MKFLAQIAAVLLLGVGVFADSHDSGNCLGAVHDTPQAQHTVEVVVWVNEKGQPIRTETTHPDTPTAKPKELLRIHETAIDILQQPEATPLAGTPAEPPAQIPKSNPIQGPQPSEKEAPEVAEKSILAGKAKEKARISPQHNPHPQVHNHPAPHQHAKPHSSKRQFGISYSPYNSDRSCRTQDQVSQDLAKLSEYSFVRIYGTDCDQTKTVTTAARRHHMQVFAGIYDLTGFPDSLQPFHDAAKDSNGKEDWSVFHTIAIGNELVNGGHSAPSDVTGAVTQARTILRGQGYKGPVVTVDTFSVLLKHPELCKVSDYCAANCHAFFDATEQPHNAGPYALEQAHSVSAAAGGKHTMITESGWPHAGEANGAAVPSPENQRVAVESLRRSFAHRGDDLILFTAFDDLWKEDNQWTFNAERFWGMHTR